MPSARTRCLSNAMPGQQSRGASVSGGIRLARAHSGLSVAASTASL